MIKTITLLRRRPDLTRGEFLRYWQQTHAQLMVRVPGVVRYVQCSPVAETASSGDEIDGIAEVWYEDEGSMARAFASPEYRALLADEVNFMGAATQESTFLVVTEADVPLPDDYGP